MVPEDTHTHQHEAIETMIQTQSCSHVLCREQRPVQSHFIGCFHTQTQGFARIDFTVNKLSMLPSLAVLGRLRLVAVVPFRF